MSTKIRTLVLSSLLSAIAIGVYAQASTVEPGDGGQKATCDSSTTNKCVIYNVGEGTGKLVAETT